MSGFSGKAASVAIVSLAWAGAASAAGPPARAVELRYRFRTGETWRERVLHEVEVRDEEGEVVSSRREARTDLAKVVSVDTKGVATIARRRETAGEGAPGGAFEYRVTARGSLDGPGAFSRFAPVVPSGPLMQGESAEREIAADLAGGSFRATERATLAGVDGPGGRQIARLELRRGPGRGTSVTPLDAVRAPERDAWLAVTQPARVRLELTGLAGEGELVFDALAGRLVSYRMLETSGLEATLVDAADGTPLGETIHWTVTVRYEVERVE